MDHFVDEVPLAKYVLSRKIVAIAAAFGMKVQMAARRHGDVARLKRKPFAAPDCDFCIVDCGAKDRARQSDLSRC
jgi:hypothetical protein